MLPVTNQNSRSLETRNVLNQFLVSDLVNLVDSYLAHADAMEVLVLGTDGQPVDSELNRTTIAAIKLALTTGTCDREIIRLIFKHADDNGYTGFLNGVLNDLREKKEAIILDDVDFSGINLSTLRFNGASLTNADFTGANLDNVGFVGSDLTGVRGLASAAGKVRMNYQTVLINTDLNILSAKLASLNYPDPFLVELPNHVDKPQQSTWHDLQIFVFPYSSATELARKGQ